MKTGWANLITGIVGIALVGSFLIGLAISIGSIPFGVIVVGVLALAAYEFYESAVLPLKGSRDD